MIIFGSKSISESSIHIPLGTKAFNQSMSLVPDIDALMPMLLIELTQSMDRRTWPAPTTLLARQRKRISLSINTRTHSSCRGCP